jgi:hypothetical protein
MAAETDNFLIIKNVIIIIIVVLILISTFSFSMSPGIKKFGYKVKFWFKGLIGQPFLY